MDGFMHFLEILGIIAACLACLAAVVFLIVRWLPESPFKDILRAFGQRVGATAAAAIIGLPLQPVPEVDGVYDIVALIFLGIYWYGLIDKVKRAGSKREAHAHILRAAPRIIKLFHYFKGFRNR